MTSQWVAKRKLFYGTVVFFVLALAIGVPLFLFFYKSPTCFDGKQNQNEKGIDCGGVCTKICPANIVAPIVLWQRSFMVTSGIYNAVAYIQNPNVLSKVDKVDYVFHLYDSNNVLIGERAGTTFIPANQTFAVFEAGIKTGGRVPARTSFVFTDSPLNWGQNDASYKLPTLITNNLILSGESTTPRIDVSVLNQSLQNVANLEAVAIVYDSDDNAIAASRTIVQNLAAGVSAPLVFTWPAPFSSQAVRKEILLRIYPAGTSF